MICFEVVKSSEWRHAPKHHVPRHEPSKRGESSDHPRWTLPAAVERAGRKPSRSRPTKENPSQANLLLLDARHDASQDQ